VNHADYEQEVSKASERRERARPVDYTVPQASARQEQDQLRFRHPAQLPKVYQRSVSVATTSIRQEVR
jgi:hypothetical protein